MQDTELEKWIQNNPMKANLIFPTIGIGCAMLLMFIGITLINKFVIG